ncbi:N-acetylmuramoyl-L-alanine amidase [Daejeonella sp.]|uniref:N-acetylmuramoyl-L-alanine amidase family protein n=1 Tax=Daejeonella sp. TaxID=2805397 RepID=UPI0030C459D2
MKNIITSSLLIITISTSFVNSDEQSIDTLPITNAEERPVIVWQPSHQTNTGINFSEAAVCNAIVEAAMDAKPRLKEHKVWSLGQKRLHHSNVGSNTIVEQTSAVINGQLSGYAWELEKANKKEPKVFISVHNNGGTKRHAVWGFIHEGDKFEAENRALASRLVKAISAATGLEDRGVLFDSSTGRNDYKCKTSGKLAFFSLDENVNKAPYRVLLEVGDNGVSKEFLENPINQRKLGEAIKRALAAWLAEKQ